MTPKKEILLVDADGLKLSLNRYRFRIYDYRVHSASTEGQAIALVRRYPDILVAVIDINGMEYDYLVGEFRTINPYMRTVLTSEFTRASELEHYADCFLGREYAGSPGILKNWVRSMAVRKRGPKTVEPAHVPLEIQIGA
jgi:hypothetical protein